MPHLEDQPSWWNWVGPAWLERSEVGEIESALLDLNGLFLALVLVISAEGTPLRLSRLGAHLCKVIRTSTLETTIIVVRARCLRGIRPRAGLLLLWWYKTSLLRWHKPSLLLLRRSNDPTPLLRGFLRGCGWSILHNLIPRCRGVGIYRQACSGIPLAVRFVGRDRLFWNSMVQGTQRFRQVWDASCVIPYVLCGCLYCLRCWCFFEGVPARPYISRGQDYMECPSRVQMESYYNTIR